MLTLIFGSTTIAVSTVLAVFMGGMALGSVILGRRLDKIRNPLLIFGILELFIGLYALAAPAFFNNFWPLYQWIWNRFSPDFYMFSIIRFILISLVLLIPTFMMGGTLPALSRFYTQRASQLGQRTGILYAVNTFGAVAGTVISGFFILPGLGDARMYTNGRDGQLWSWCVCNNRVNDPEVAKS